MKISKMTNQQIKKWTPITSVAAITILELYALYQGINGTMLATSMAIIAGIGGYQIPNIKNFFKK